MRETRCAIGTAPSARIVARALTAAVLLAAGCTGRTVSTATSPKETPSVAVPVGGNRPYVRACDDSVYGNLGPDWRQGQITIGPVTFIGLRSVESAKPSRFVPKSGRSQGQKVLAVVRNGTSVTVQVSPEEHVALLYDPKTFSAHSVSEGDSAVTLESCKAGESPFGAQAAKHATQFNGGFIVDGPRCVRIDVQVAGGVTGTRSIPFGRGETCP